MKTLESVKLREVLKLVAKPRYILGTTYTLSLAFFESAIFPEFKRDQLKSCLIVCDKLGYANALTEAAALQGAAQDYLVVRAPIPGSFHPKVWLIVADNEAVLLTGSGNLTQAGFMTNAELFDALHFTPEHPPSADLLADLRSFVTGLAGMWHSEDHHELLCVDALKEMNQALARLPVATSQESNPIRFLHSYQKPPLIEQLPMAANAKELYIAAPFFGDSVQGINLLAARYPAARLHLFPAVHSGNTTNLPLAQVSKSHPQARVNQLSIPAKKDAFAHLKLYGVALADETAWLYCTSANCTQAAWQGPNIEAGLWRAIPPTRLAEYFVPGKAKLPLERLEFEGNHAVADSLQCWGADNGEGLDLLISSIDRHHLPLSDVRLTVRTGSGLATCEKSSLFQSNGRAHVSWTAFDGWQRRRKAAICLELQARDVHGKPVHAICLIENRLLLSADPIHRSAWRGTLALLDAEGTTEFGDIAAIFTLVNDIFDGTTIRLPEVKPAEGSSQTKAKPEPEPPAIAIWPPQPDDHELRRRIGSTAHGQLQWFQNILKSLLQTEATSTNHRQPEPGRANLADDEQDDHGAAHREIEQKIADKEKLDQASKQAKRNWEHAYKDYSRLRDKLKGLCPSAEKAHNIWPASIFAFLSTMAVFQDCKKKAPDLSLGVSAEVLCDDYLRAMFNHRPQPEDYCVPRGFRYRSEKFPPLANDLYSTFKLQPQHQLATVLLSLVIDRRLRNPLIYGGPAGKNAQLDLICEPSFVASADTREACRRLWRRYLCDPKRTAIDALFDKEFDTMFKLKSEGSSL